MTRSRSYVGWIIACVLGVLAGVGLAVVLAIYLIGQAISSLLAGPAPLPFDSLGGVVQITTPAQPNSLAWSPDGAYLAGGTWDSPPFTGVIGMSGDVYVIDVNASKVLHTLQQKAWVRGLAFSPDGKWLAVATAHLAIGPQAAELVVYDVPGFTPQFRAKADGAGGFMDLAWTMDSQTLWALDKSGEAMKKSGVKGWTIPGFEERLVIREPQGEQFEALAIAPIGHTLAVADKASPTGARLIRLFDAVTGKEQSTFVAKSAGAVEPRLGFSPDGKTLGVEEIPSNLTWWDTATGRETNPERAQFAAPLAGRDHFASQHALSPDGTRQVDGSKNQAKLLFQGLGGPPNQFGLFVKMTDLTTTKDWVWRLGDEFGSEPAVAFSPDGKRLAATVGQPTGGTVIVWDVPK